MGSLSHKAMQTHRRTSLIDRRICTAGMGFPARTTPMSCLLISSYLLILGQSSLFQRLSAVERHSITTDRIKPIPRSSLAETTSLTPNFRDPYLGKHRISNSSHGFPARLSCQSLSLAVKHTHPVWQRKQIEPIRARPRSQTAFNAKAEHEDFKRKLERRTKNPLNILTGARHQQPRTSSHIQATPGNSLEYICYLSTTAPPRSCWS